MNPVEQATLPSGIEDLREKREEVQKQIRDEEGEKAKLQQDLQVLTKRLAHINDGLARKVRRACSTSSVAAQACIQVLNI